MNPNDKALYQQSSKLCKERYVHEMSGMRLPALKPARGKSSRDRTKPEPIDTPFRAFCRQTKPVFESDNPDYDYYQMKTLLQDVWDVLDDDQKKYYEDLAQ